MIGVCDVSRGFEVCAVLLALMSRQGMYTSFSDMFIIWRRGQLNDDGRGKQFFSELPYSYRAEIEDEDLPRERQFGSQGDETILLSQQTQIRFLRDRKGARQKPRSACEGSIPIGNPVRG